MTTLIYTRTPTGKYVGIVDSSYYEFHLALEHVK